MNGGRSASAPSRPRGPGRSAGHAISEGLKPDLAENANEDTSGLAPGLGNGVSRGRTNTADGSFAFELHVRDHCLTSQGGQTAKLRWSECFRGRECTSNIKVLVCTCKQFRTVKGLARLLGSPNNLAIRGGTESCLTPLADAGN